MDHAHRFQSILPLLSMLSSILSVRVIRGVWSDETVACAGKEKQPIARRSKSRLGDQGSSKPIKSTRAAD